MPMSAKGLNKLTEEIGELLQVVGKKLAYPHTEHPDGNGSLDSRLEDEMGDVLAAIDFVTLKLYLDMDRIEHRKLQKFSLYEEWDSQP